MKKISTFLTAMLISIISFAATSTKLTISSVIDHSLTLTIDNRSYNVRQNDNGYVLNDIAPGYHNIRLYKKSSGRNNRNSSQLIYNGNVYVKNGYHTDIIINRFGKAFVDEQPLGRNNGYDDDTYGNQGGYNGNYNNNNDRQAMSSYSFDQLKRTAINERFDNTRLTMIRSAIDDNLFTSLQAKQLIQLFSFDDSRLQLAKLIYANVTDRNNFTTVYDAFTYSSSKEELARYIRQYR